MTSGRLSLPALERLAASLSERDQAILADVVRLRVLTGRQLERLYFHDLHGTHRDRSRRRVLARLVDTGVLTTLDRRIGGARAGSSGLVFAVGPAGQRLQQWRGRDEQPSPARRVRQPDTPTVRFLDHQLAVSELYVALSELTRGGDTTLTTFRAEPACWWPDRDGQWIKPDAYLCLETAVLVDQWAVEVDRSTESLPTLRRKLSGYLTLAARDEPGPAGSVFPRVLLTVPDERRQAALQQLVAELPDPAAALFAVVRHDAAATFMLDVLRE